MHRCSQPTAFAAQLETLTALDADLDALTARHQHARRHWQPGELLDFGSDEQLHALARLRQRARGLPSAVKVALLLNLVTEERLPLFHGAVAEHLGAPPAWKRWTWLWAAEEDQHANVLRDYSRDAALYEPAALDRLQFSFLNSGFDPEWADSPYRLLAYTSLQERATQIAHANCGRLAGALEPLLQRVLGLLAEDEALHCAFYRDAFALALRADADSALAELAEVAPKMALPSGTIPGYLMMSEIEREAGIFGPRDYAELVRESLDYWDVAACRPSTGAGRAAQDELLALPAQLLQLAGRLESRRRHKTFEFDFLRSPVAAVA